MDATWSKSSSPAPSHRWQDFKPLPEYLQFLYTYKLLGGDLDRILLSELKQACSIDHAMPSGNHLCCTSSWTSERHWAARTQPRQSASGWTPSSGRPWLSSLYGPTGLSTPSSQSQLQVQLTSYNSGTAHCPGRLDHPTGAVCAEAPQCLCKC